MIRKIDKSIDNALVWATTTKQAFYVLNVLIIISVITSPPTTIQGWLLVVVSVYYQGVALPGLGSQTKNENEKTRQDNEVTRQLLQETHDMVMDELDLVKQELTLAKQERVDMRELIEIVKMKNNINGILNPNMFTKNELETLLNWYGVVVGEYHGSEEEDKLVEKMERLIRDYSERN